MAEYIRVPSRSILTRRVLELSEQLVRELKLAMKEKQPSKDMAEAQVAKLCCQVWNESERAIRTLRDDAAG